MFLICFLGGPLREAALIKSETKADFWEGGEFWKKSHVWLFPEEEVNNSANFIRFLESD